jgi:hypothetical protein
MKEHRKGYTLMIDALIALIFMLIITTTIYSMSFSRNAKTDIMSFKELHYKSEDVLDVLNKKGVLDNVSTSWADNSTAGSDEMVAAEALAKDYIEKMLPAGVGYNLTIEEGIIPAVSIASSNETRSVMEDSSTATHSTRILVGYGSGMPTYSFVSRASLNSISNTAGSEYAYFGGFVGQGNITRFVTVPDDATFPKDSYMELDAGSEFNLLVNGVPCGGPYPGVGLALAANSANLPGSCFSAGVNNLTIKFTTSTNNFIGGGYIRINYRSDDWRRMPEFQKYWFPGIKGLINLYSGFYVPSTIQRMIIHLKYRNDVEISPGVGANLSLNLAGVEIYRNDALGDVTVDLDTLDDEIFVNWSGATLGDQWDSFSFAVNSKTVPVRFGTETFSTSTTESSTADAVVVTDVSISMDDCNINSVSPCDCSGVSAACPSGCCRDKLKVAQEVDKVFVTKMLSYPGTRVGLVSYSTKTKSTVDPTGSASFLNGIINGYNSDYATCISCGVNNATRILKKPFSVVNKSAGGWRMTSKSNCGNSCDPTTENSGSCYVNGWYGPSEPTASIYSTIFLQDSGVAKLLRYYRKNFTVVYPPSGDGTIYVVHTGGVECYLNSKSIGSDSNCGPATNKWNVPKSYFRLGQNVLACRVRSKTGGTLVFNANVSYPRKRAMLVMSDGEANTNIVGTTDLSSTCMGCGVNCHLCAAAQEAVTKACEARAANITVYSVAFGADAENTTLKKIACWNCSACNPNIRADTAPANCWLSGTSYNDCKKFFSSNDADELKSIYEEIAGTIAESSMELQTIVIDAGVIPMGSILDPSSYIQFNVSVPPMLGYGETLLPLESAPLSSSGIGSFNIPVGAKALDVKVTSYSGPYWTKMLKVNSTATSGVWQTVYNLTKYGSDYTMLGDPYFVNVPNDKVESGKNYVNLTVGSPDTNVGASTSDKVLYKVAIKALTAYGTPKRLSEGCNWTVQFFDNTEANITAPYGYKGLRHCNYTSFSIAYDKNSSVDEAVYMLFKQLDSDNPPDGRLDSKFNPDDMYIETTTVGGVRSLWGPIRVKLTLWM